MVDSCQQCQSCQEGVEQYCLEGFTLTYGGDDRHDGSMTQGGYSSAIVVSERFVLRIPAGLDPAAAAQMAAVAGSFDYMLDTVPVQHDLTPYMAALKRDGIHILLGLIGNVEPPLSTFSLVFRRQMLAGSLIGGVRETQQLLDFCAEHNITCDIEKVAMQNINTAFERMFKGDVRYRFVIDMSTLE